MAIKGLSDLDFNTHSPQHKTTMEKKELEKLLAFLEAQVDYRKSLKHDLSKASWQYEEGILITGNDAVIIMEALSAILEDNK